MSQVTGSAGAAAPQGRPWPGGSSRHWRWETLAWQLALPCQAAFHLPAPDPAQGSAQLVFLPAERNGRSRQGRRASPQPGLVPAAAQGVRRAGVRVSPSEGGGNLSQRLQNQGTSSRAHTGALCDPEPGGPAPPARRGWAVRGAQHCWAEGTGAFLGWFELPLVTGEQRHLLPAGTPSSQALNTPLQPHNRPYLGKCPVLRTGLCGPVSSSEEWVRRVLGTGTCRYSCRYSWLSVLPLGAALAN